MQVTRRNSWLRIGALAGAFCGICITGSVQAQSTMSQSELQKLFSGITIQHVSPRSGKKLHMFFQPGGSARVVVGQRRDVGRWWVGADGVFCMQFKKAVRGRRICHYLHRKGRRLERLKVRNRRPKRGIDWLIVGRGDAGAASGKSAGVTGAMAKPQVTALFRRYAVSFRNKKGKLLRVTFRSGGNVVAAVTGGRRKQDTGRWWLTKGKIMCFQFKHGGKGKKFCRLLVRRQNRLAVYHPRKKTLIRNWTLVRR